MCSAACLAEDTFTGRGDLGYGTGREQDRLQADVVGMSRMKSTLVASKDETRQCYNCGEIGHLKLACPKPLKENFGSGRRQLGSRGGRDRRGHRGGGRGGYRTNLMVADEEKEGCVTDVSHSEEKQVILDAYALLMKRKKKEILDDSFTSFSSRSNTEDNFASFAHSITGTCENLLLHLYPPLDHQIG